MAETAAADKVGPMLASTAATRSFSISSRHGKLLDETSSLGQERQALSHLMCNPKPMKERSLLRVHLSTGPCRRDVDARSHACDAPQRAHAKRRARELSLSWPPPPVVEQISPRREQRCSWKSPDDAIRQNCGAEEHEPASLPEPGQCCGRQQRVARTITLSTWVVWRWRARRLAFPSRQLGECAKPRGTSAPHRRLSCHQNSGPATVPTQSCWPRQYHARRQRDLANRAPKTEATPSRSRHVCL